MLPRCCLAANPVPVSAVTGSVSSPRRAHAIPSSDGPAASSHYSTVWVRPERAASDCPRDLRKRLGASGMERPVSLLRVPGFRHAGRHVDTLFCLSLFWVGRVNAEPRAIRSKAERAQACGDPRRAIDNNEGGYETTYGPCGSRDSGRGNCDERSGRRDAFSPRRQREFARRGGATRLRTTDLTLAEPDASQRLRPRSIGDLARRSGARACARMRSPMVLHQARGHGRNSDVEAVFGDVPGRAMTRDCRCGSKSRAVSSGCSRKAASSRSAC